VDDKDLVDNDDADDSADDDDDGDVKNTGLRLLFPVDADDELKSDFVGVDSTCRCLESCFEDNDSRWIDPTGALGGNRRFQSMGATTFFPPTLLTASGMGTFLSFRAPSVEQA